MIPEELFVLPNKRTSSGEWDRDMDLLACFVKALFVVKKWEFSDSLYINLTEAKRILKEREAFAWSSFQSITVCIRI